jgi:hypothetical protein
VKLEVAVGRAIGVAVKRRFFWHESIGVVAGFELADGRRIAAKAHPPSFTRRYLEATVVAQSVLAGTGLPVARSVGRPFAWGDRFVTLHQWLGVAVSAPVPSDIGPSAEALRKLVTSLSDEPRPDLGLLPLFRRAGDRYGPPHDTIFDFVGTAVGAEWIDEYADIAAKSLDGKVMPLVVGHNDWAARNVVVVHGETKAIFDLDSLCLSIEERIVGSAAVTWATTGETSSPFLSDTAGIDAFVRSYANDSLDGRLVAAGALENLAYQARCEHALDRTKWRRRQTRDHLRRVGPELRARILTP